MIPGRPSCSRCRALVGELTDTHEAGSARPWAVSDAPEDYVRSMLAGVVGIDIEVQRVTAKFKLSQNHPQEARMALAQALREGSEDAR